MKKLYTITLFCLSIAIWGQKNVDPSPQEVEKAKEIRQQYNTSDIAILNSLEKIEFKKSNDRTNVEVKHNVKEELLNINHRADIHKYEFYDSQSSINTFAIKYKNNKATNFNSKDEFYKSDDLFYNDARVKYFTLDFPVQGYSYLYELEKNTKDIKYFTTIYFNDEYPVIQKEVTITIPNWLNLDIKEFNFENFEISKKESKSEESTTVTYTIKNIPPISQDQMKPGASYIYPHILFVAKSFTDKNNTINLFGSTADQYKWYKSLIDLMKDDTSVFADKVLELTKNAKTDDEKIKNIYYWVQDNIRYIAFEDGIAGFKPDDSQSVYTKRYGDCKGMANLTKQMLKLAGFDARLCWIGTKIIAYDYSIPSLSVDNHMICAVFKGGKKIFLDATEKHNAFGEYADRIQGKEVLIENGDTFLIEKVPSVDSKFNIETSVYHYTIDSETLKGNVIKNFSGESRTSFLQHYNTIKNDKKEDAIMRYLTLDDINYTISNIKTSDLLNRDTQLKLNFDVAIKNQVSSFDDEIYVDLDYYKEYKSYDFTKRKEDLVFHYKTLEDIQIKLDIPQGYHVTTLPKNLQVETSDYSITITYENKGNQIVYHKIFDFKTGFITKQNFENWTKHLAEINKLYTEQIVLSKK